MAADRQDALPGRAGSAGPLLTTMPRKDSNTGHLAGISFISSFMQVASFDR